MAVPWTETDAQGRFKFTGLRPGRTYVNAFEEKAFYPNASSNFWDDEGGAEVELPDEGEVSDVVLTLKPVGGLKVKAKNTANGAAIAGIGVRLERDGTPNRWIQGGRWDDSWLVPTAPIRLCVDAAGFQPAWYGGDGSFERSVPITLSPRQAFTAVVSLRPLNRVAGHMLCSPSRSQ